MITQLTELEYRQFQQEYNDYLDGRTSDKYLGTNPQLKALEEVITNAPIRKETDKAKDPILDTTSTSTGQSKQAVHCLVEETVQINL